MVYDGLVIAELVIASRDLSSRGCTLRNVSTNTRVAEEGVGVSESIPKTILAHLLVGYFVLNLRPGDVVLHLVEVQAGGNRTDTCTNRTTDEGTGGRARAEEESTNTCTHAGTSGGSAADTCCPDCSVASTVILVLTFGNSTLELLTALVVFEAALNLACLFVDPVANDLLITLRVSVQLLTLILGQSQVGHERVGVSLTHGLVDVLLRRALALDEHVTRLEVTDVLALAIIGDNTSEVVEVSRVDLFLLRALLCGVRVLKEGRGLESVLGRTCLTAR